MYKKYFIIIFAFLICSFFIIDSIPVNAGVEFNDDDDYVVSEDTYNAYRKLALLGSLGDLVSQGITEFTISDADNVDDFLDSILSNLSSGLDDDNPISNLGLGIWETLDDFNTFLHDKAYDLIANLDIINLGSSRLSDLIIDLSGIKTDYKPNNNAFNHFEALSHVSEDIHPQPSPDFSFIQNINNIYIRYNDVKYDFFNLDIIYWYNGFRTLSHSRPMSSYSFMLDSPSSGNNPHISSMGTGSMPGTFLNNIVSIYVTVNDDDSVSVRYDNVNPVNPVAVFSNLLPPNSNQYEPNFRFDGFSSTETRFYTYTNSYSYFNFLQSSFEGLSSALNYIYTHYANINLYVDGTPWVLANNDTISIPLLDINGILKLFDSNKPVTYYYPNDTKIDYEALYNVILQAIIDGTPVSQNTINEGDVYYDSHDNVYSPNIYNYYSDGDNQDDWIESLLDLATIPNFDSALVNPLSSPMTDGAVVAVESTRAIPEDILKILGCSFVLILFVALINRLIE